VNPVSHIIFAIAGTLLLLVCLLVYSVVPIIAVTALED